MNMRDDLSGIYSSKRHMTDEALLNHKKMLYDKINKPLFVLGDDKDMNELAEIIINYF